MHLVKLALLVKRPGKYNMYLGAAFDGSRLSKMYRENIGEEEILNELRVHSSSLCKRTSTKASTLVTLSSVLVLSKQRLTAQIFMIDKKVKEIGPFRSLLYVVSKVDGIKF